MHTISEYLNERLTQREKEIISHIANGLSSKQIASKLYISKHTVDTHRRNLLRKQREIFQPSVSTDPQAWF